MKRLADPTPAERPSRRGQIRSRPGLAHGWCVRHVRPRPAVHGCRDRARGDAGSAHLPRAESSGTAHVATSPWQRRQPVRGDIGETVSLPADLAAASGGLRVHGTVTADAGRASGSAGPLRRRPATSRGHASSTAGASGGVRPHRVMWAEHRHQRCHADPVADEPWRSHRPHVWVRRSRARPALHWRILTSCLSDTSGGACPCVGGNRNLAEPLLSMGTRAAHSPLGDRMSTWTIWSRTRISPRSQPATVDLVPEAPVDRSIRGSVGSPSRSMNRPTVARARFGCHSSRSRVRL